jgi:hypothetical protein
MDETVRFGEQQSGHIRHRKEGFRGTREFADHGSGESKLYLDGRVWSLREFPTAHGADQEISQLRGEHEAKCEEDSDQKQPKACAQSQP